MNAYGSDDGTDCSLNGSELNQPPVLDKFRGLLGGPRVQVYKGDLGELKNWITAIEKKQLIYELSEVETALLAYDAAERLVSEFIGSDPAGYPELAWAELENLLIK